VRLVAIVLIALHGRCANTLRSEEEERSHFAAIANLDANQRRRVDLAVLMVVVFGLGAAGMAMVTRRRRSDMTQAYEALRGEIDERRAAQEGQRANEARFRSLVQRASDLTVVTDESGVIGYVSPAAETLLGYRPEDLLGLPLLNQVAADQRADVARAVVLLAEHPGLVHRIELRLGTRDGRVRLVEALCQNLVEDPDVRGLVWNGRDVTDRRAFEDELSHQALHDPLTGLPNRVLLLNRLSEALRCELASGSSVSVILVDLDGFKNVNDALGHPAGDELLQFAAQRLLGCVREGDTAARLGGDEFAVLAGEPHRAVAVGRRIVDVLSQPFTVAGQKVRVSASIGVAHRQGSESAEELLRDADIAMYVAKNRGSGHVEVFEPDMGVRASRRISLQQQLARAVELGEIGVHYQPIIDLKTSRPTTLEALARWRRPDRSLVPADVFIPIAEETGAIVEIGREVLRQACHAVQLWRRTVPGHSDLGVAVNVSVHQVLSGRLVEHVSEALKDSGIPPSALTLEITESTALEDPDRVAAEFALLRRLGVRIAVDDFGSGYSSLGFLMRLTVDVLKIDSTLLDFDTTRRGSLVTAVAELGRTLGLTVVVEGVETPDHLARAFEAACDAAQGYHFSRPLAFEDVPGFFDGWPDEE
jgi:diguanylate cyclase (GGDEF)-like protein/PAS domain S-box-containing protein